MMARPTLVVARLLLWSSLIAGPALAQEVDPIGDLLTAPKPSAPIEPQPVPPPPAPQPAPETITTSPEAPPSAAAAVPTPAGPAPAVQQPVAVQPEPAPILLPSVVLTPEVSPAAPPLTAPTPVAEAPPPPIPLPQPVLTQPQPQPQPRARPPAPRASQGTPVKIDELGRTPDSPPTATDLNYEGRIRSTFNAAEGLQGPLDGRWVVRVGGVEVYDLQLVDKGQGVLEGAWRDPRRRGAADATGFINEITRIAGQLTIRFQARRVGGLVELNLDAGADGRWSGQLTDKGERRSVTMTRN